MADTQAAAPHSNASSWTQALEGFRCRHCQRLLLKITPDALKACAALEIKCACKTMNYLMGQ